MRYTLGEFVPLSVWCRNLVGTPVLPDAAPIAAIYSDTGKAAEFKMPICDRFRVNGYFAYGLFLGKGIYATGRYRVRYQYVIDGDVFAAEQVFEVIPGGNEDGTGISTHFYRRPQSSFLLMQSMGGRVMRRRNPHLPG